MNNTTIPEMSVDTRLLYERIRNMKVDEVVPYDDLSALIGRDVRGKARHNLVSAKRRALHADHIVTEAVSKVGIKRLSDKEILGVGEHVRAHIRRASGRAVRKLTSVNFNALPPDQKIKHNAELSQLSAVRAFSRDNVTDRIAHKVDAKISSATPLAIAKTLEAFKE